MARILITSGPTRQYLDPVRFLSNGSSGRMGSCLAAAAIGFGHEVVIVSGPVSIEYPQAAEVINVVSTEDMLRESELAFPKCDGMISAAAPCDYQPVEVAEHKLKKDGNTLTIELSETSDILATLGAVKTGRQWLVGFALESESALANAHKKLVKKNCDLMVINDPTAIDSNTNRIQLMGSDGKIVLASEGNKLDVAGKIFSHIQEHLCRQPL